MINIDAIKPQIKKVAEKYSLSLVLLFGSHATGHVHKNSDVDVGYVPNKDIGYDENCAISSEFARIFKDQDTELVNIYNVSPAMKKQIAETAVVLYEKNSTIFDYFNIHAFRQYLDTKPLRTYRDYLVKDFIKAHA